MNHLAAPRTAVDEATAFRYSLWTLFAGVGLLAIAFTYFERWTMVDVGFGQHTTHLVHLRDTALAPQIHRWLSERGFTRTRDVPLEVHLRDPLGELYRNYYIGSHQGSAPFYVSVNPNWGAGTGPDADESSNVMIYGAVHCRCRIWDARKTRQRFAAFMRDFQEWCQTIGTAGQRS